MENSAELLKLREENDTLKSTIDHLTKLLARERNQNAVIMLQFSEFQSDLIKRHHEIEVFRRYWLQTPPTFTFNNPNLMEKYPSKYYWGANLAILLRVKDSSEIVRRHPEFGHHLISGDELKWAKVDLGMTSSPCKGSIIFEADNVDKYLVDTYCKEFGEVESIPGSSAGSEGSKLSSEKSLNITPIDQAAITSGEDVTYYDDDEEYTVWSEHDDEEMGYEDE